MLFLIETFGPGLGWLVSALSVFLRYSIFAGSAFLFFYIFRKNKYLSLRIQKRFPKARQIWVEVKQSGATALVFGLIGVGIYFLTTAGYTKIYQDINHYGWAYLLFTFVFLVVIHDTYFYWMHRLMHHPRLFPYFHRVHHLSSNPTPWTSLSFHPLEAAVEIGIVPLAIFFLPVHPIALFAFATWSLTWNIIGHLGFEIFPKGFVHHPVFQWFNTSTHHNMHHERSGCNYGLYFNFWDTVMETNHKKYRATFDRITQNKSA